MLSTIGCCSSRDKDPWLQRLEDESSDGSPAGRRDGTTTSSASSSSLQSVSSLARSASALERLGADLDELLDRLARADGLCAEPAASSSSKKQRARRSAEEREREKDIFTYYFPKAKREAEAEAKEQADAKAREAEDQVRLQAVYNTMRARLEEAKAMREAEAEAKKQAEAKAKEAEATAKKEVEEKARQEADAKAKKEADELLRREAELARRAGELARREAELARKDADVPKVSQQIGAPMPSEPVGSFGGFLPTLLGGAQKTGQRAAAPDAKAAAAPIPVYFSASDKRLMHRVLQQEVAAARPMTAEEAAEYCPQGVAPGFRAFLIPARQGKTAVADTEEDASGDFGVADRSAARLFGRGLF